MLERGSRLGPYEIDSLIGRGGMGEVYRGRDVRLRRPVAIKVLSSRLVRDHDAIARFRREAETASALNHPHVLTIYDIGEADIPGSLSIHYIAMELIEGRTLRELIRESSGDPLQQLRWMQQVASGLAKAHGAGIVHRDLKPDNVMVSVDGFAKILDFGLAKLSEQWFGQGETTVQPPQSQTGVLMGTVGYLSPEQASGKEVDFRSDQFAVGCILYELASGRQPFSSDSVVDTLHLVMHAEPPPLGRAIPADLDRIISKCLEKEPDRRYQSTRDLALDLDDMIERSAGKMFAPAEPIPLGTTTREGSSGVKPRGLVIAVLPFADLSPGHDHEYIGDGLADEIIADLSRLRGLRVIARTSAMQYRRTSKPARQIASELAVAFVLTGSVRVAGERLRITTELVRAADDRSVWVDRMDGTLEDIFDIQEKVARTVAEQLRVQISPEESDALRARPLANVQAFECYLRARRHIWEFTDSSLQRALDEIDHAERIVGENSLLLASKAYVHFQYYNAGIHPETQSLDKAEQFVNRIVAIDPASPQIDVLRGLIETQRGNIAGSVRHLRQALKRDPNEIDALPWLVVMLVLVGRTDEARPLGRRLGELDPLAWMSRVSPMAIEMYAGTFDLALELVASLAPSDYQIPIVAMLVVELYAQLGRIDDAAGRARSMAARDANDPFTRMALMLVDALQGRPREARVHMTDAVVAMARADLQYSHWMAEILALMGDRDGALDWLTHAIGRGFLNYPLIARHDRLLDGLRADPRFTALLEDLRAKWIAFGESDN